VEFPVQAPLEERSGKPGCRDEQQGRPSGSPASPGLRAEPVVRPTAKTGGRVEPMKFSLCAVQTCVPRPHQAVDRRGALAQRIKRERCFWPRFARSERKFFRSNLMLCAALLVCCCRFFGLFQSRLFFCIGLLNVLANGFPFARRSLGKRIAKRL